MGRSFWQRKVLMPIFAGVRLRVGVNESVVVENGDFRFFHSLSSERFAYMATQQLLCKHVCDVIRLLVTLAIV